MTTTHQYTLQWRGAKKGPWTLDTIRQALQSGEIHSLYQIENGNGWQPLRDFLSEQQERSAEQEAREARLDAEERLNAEYEGKFRALETQVAEAQRREAAALAASQQAAKANAAPWPFPPPPPAHQTPAEKTSGLAVASFVLSLCFFIPLLGFATLPLSLVFGHVALSQMKHQPRLGGRGLAIAGVVISYVILSAVLFLIILILLSPQLAPGFWPY